MVRTREETPDKWATWGDMEVKHAGADIYYTIIADGVVQGGKASNVWVWHWHHPTTSGVEPRWQLSGCGLHTVVQVEPLTLTASLACDDGCDSHGFLENGAWRSV